MIGLARTLSQHWDTANSKYRESTSQNAGLLSTIGSYFTSFLPTSLSGGNVSNVNLHSHAYGSVTPCALITNEAPRNDTYDSYVYNHTTHTQIRWFGPYGIDAAGLL